MLKKDYFLSPGIVIMITSVEERESRKAFSVCTKLEEEIGSKKIGKIPFSMIS